MINDTPMYDAPPIPNTAPCKKLDWRKVNNVSDWWHMYKDHVNWKLDEILCEIIEEIEYREGLGYNCDDDVFRLECEYRAVEMIQEVVKQLQFKPEEV